MSDSLSGMREPLWKRHHVLLWCSLSAALALSLWLSGIAGRWLPGAPETPPQPVGRPEGDGLLAVAPADLPVFVRDRYRLRPDRRLLAAVAAIHRLRTGTAPESVRTELQQDGRWRILAGSDEVGVLSEFPDFEEGTELLVRWLDRAPEAAAGGRSPDTAALEKALPTVDAAALLQALAALGGSLADVERDEAKVHTIAAGLAWLSTLTVDHLEQADALPGEAWAWLAIERARTAAPSPGTEALLARTLGYEAAARRAGEKLADNEPVRFYALSDERRLAVLCAGRPKDGPTHFLRLVLLAEARQDERFRSALEMSPFRGETSLALRGLETRLSDFDGGNAGRDLAELALRTVGLPASSEGTSAEARTRDFEAAVSRLPSGGLLDSAALQEAHRAFFYSGLWDQARFMVDQYASGTAAQDLAAGIDNPAPGAAQELRTWLEVNAPVLDGARDMRPAAKLLASAQSIGAVPLFDLSLVIAKHVATTDPLRRGPIPALFARMDARPSHRAIAARVVDRHLVSPGLFEKLASAAADAAPHLSQDLPAQVAEMRADVKRLREIAHDPAMPVYAQIVALDALASLGKADDALIRKRYEEIAANPDEGPDYLVSFLEERGDLAGAVAALDSSLQRTKDPMVAAHLHTEKARLLLKMGNVERAYAAVQPALESGKEEALLEAAAIELARKQPDRALELAQAALDRYPDRSSKTSGLIARARWQKGQYAIAAKELAESRNGIVGPWNRHLPEAFVEAFAKAPEDEMRKAFNELANARIAPHVLAAVAVALGKQGDLAVVLPLLEGLRDPAPEWQDYIRFATYDLIKEKSGADAALTWVRKAVPDRSHNFALTLYQMRRYDLLLGLFANGEPSTNPTLIRMIKAAAHLHLRETSGPRWDGLVAEIQSDPADDFFARGARYLVGKTDQAKVFETFPHDGDPASIGWIQGVKAASEHRFADADAWFQVALESGLQQQPPHAWSWVIENEWRQAERSLAVLEKTGAF